MGELLSQGEGFLVTIMTVVPLALSRGKGKDGKHRILFRPTKQRSLLPETQTVLALGNMGPNISKAPQHLKLIPQY